MKQLFCLFLVLCITAATAAVATSEPLVKNDSMPITITVNDHTISAVLYDTAPGRALWDMLPFTVMMRNAFEREMISFLPVDALPSDDAQNPESGSESSGEGGPKSSAENDSESFYYDELCHWDMEHIGDYEKSSVTIAHVYKHSCIQEAMVTLLTSG